MLYLDPGKSDRCSAFFMMNGGRKLFCLFICMMGFGGGNMALAQGISPSQEQELIDARAAIDVARKAGAETLAEDALGRAVKELLAVDAARAAKEPERFSHSARRARAYAELAVARAQLAAENLKLKSLNESVESAKSEVYRLGTSR